MRVTRVGNGHGVVDLHDSTSVVRDNVDARPVRDKGRRIGRKESQGRRVQILRTTRRSKRNANHNVWDVGPPTRHQ